MNKYASTVLRMGLGLAFLWIALLIWRDPVLWAGFLPIWLQDILPVSSGAFMQGVAVFDAVVGFFLVLNRFTRIVSALAALHLLGLVLTLGFNDIAARDFGLMAASVAVFFDASQSKS